MFVYEILHSSGPTALRTPDGTDPATQRGYKMLGAHKDAPW